MKIAGYDTVARGMPKGVPAPVGTVEVASAPELRFKAGAVEVKPLYRIADERYGVYWQKS